MTTKICFNGKQIQLQGITDEQKNEIMNFSSELYNLIFKEN